MEANFNLGSLKIVQAPLLDYFKQVSKNLSESLDELREGNKNPSKYEYLPIVEKIQKTLRMIGLNGFARVLNSVETSVEEVKKNAISLEKQVKVLTLVDKMVKDGALYIQALVSGAADQPIKFFEDYKELNSLVGKSVDVKDLFYPKLDFRTSFSEEIKQELKTGLFVNDINKDSIVSNVKRIQSGLVNNLTEIEAGLSSKAFDAKFDEHVKSAIEQLNDLQNLKLSKNIYIISGLGNLYFSLLSPSLNQNFNAASFSLEVVSGFKEMINSLSKLISEMEDGEKTGTIKVSEDLSKNVLFELLRLIDLGQIDESKDSFIALDNYFDIKSFGDQLLDTKIDLASSSHSSETALQVERLFGELKEEFTLLGSKKGGSQESFLQQLHKVIQINNKLLESVVSVREINSILSQVSTCLAAIKAQTVKFTDILEKELSLALVLTEYGINNFIKNVAIDNNGRVDFVKQSQIQIERLELALNDNISELERKELPKLDFASQKADEKKTYTKIFDQVHQELVKVEETLDMFMRSDDENSQDLATIVKPLSGMKGIFSVVNKPVLGSAIESILKVWKQIIESGKSSVPSEEITDTISLLSGVSLFISAYKNENDAEAEEIYENIIKRFAHLEKAIKTNEVKKEEVVSLPEKEVVSEIVETVEVVAPVVSEVVEAKKEETSKKIAGGFIESPEDADLAEVFLLEAEEVLENLVSGINSLEKNLSDREELTNVRRYFHTLKGSGKMVGLMFFGEAGWMVEQSLNKALQGDILFDEKFLNAVKVMKLKFDDWVKTLKETNSVEIDLASVKKLFLTINPGLTNNIEIDLSEKSESKEDVKGVEPVSVIQEIADIQESTALAVEVENERVDEPQVVEPVIETVEIEPVVELVNVEDLNVENESAVEVIVPEPVVEEIVEEVSEIIEEDNESNKDVVIIDNKEIPMSLFELFNEESAIHLKVLKDFAEAHYEKSVRLTEDFMRHAHTLASISRTVNMQKIAKIAGLIEAVTTVAMEKQMDVSASEMNVIRHAVSGLENFKVLSSDLDQSYFETIIEHLSQLHNSLIERQDPPYRESKQVIDVDSVLLAISNNVQQIVSDSLVGVSEKINSLKEKVEQNQTIDFDELTASINETIEENNKKILSSFEQERNENKQIINALSEKLEGLDEKLQKAIAAEQRKTEGIMAERVDFVRKDIRILANMLKKKSAVFFNKVVPVSVQIEIVADLADLVESAEYRVEDLINSINVSQNFETVLIESKSPKIKEESVGSIMKETIKETVPTVIAGFVESNSANKFLEENPFIKSIFEEKVSTVVDELDEEIYEISKPEAEEMMEKIVPILDSITEGGLSNDLSNELKRYMHTFKGSVRMAGANRIGMLAHRLESLMDYIQERNLNVFDIKDILEKEVEKMSFMMANQSAALSPEKLLWLDSLIVKGGLVNVSGSSALESSPSIQKDVTVGEVKTEKDSVVKEQKQFIRIGADVVDSVIRNAGDIRLTRTTLESVLSGNKKLLTDLRGSSDKLLAMLKEIEVQAESQIQAKKDVMDEESDDFDPLEFDRFTRLQELSRFMNETVSDIQDNVMSIDDSVKIQEASVVEQSILTNNLLDDLMKVRLLQFGSISERLYKISRNTAKELQKMVRLELLGEKTELDRLVLDKVISPIEHLLRNSIAHGIEEPKERLAKGKPQAGTIEINAYLDGNYVVIKIKDDGAGINVEKIKQIALKKGLIKATDNLTKDQAVNLIYQPGFSTADVVSQVSGRGVGMDVVRSEVVALGGTITTKTEKDLGTEFSIVLPVAVATNNAMLTNVMNKLIAVPTAMIGEIFSVKQNKLEEAYASGKIDFKGKSYEMFYLGHLTGILPSNQVPEIKVYNTLIKVDYQGKTLMVHIDKIVSTSEILIKSMGSFFSKIDGVLGATLLGDGTQGMVVNPIMLREHFDKYIKNIGISSGGSNSVVEDAHSSTRTVLVVDDSMTVRRATTKVLEKNGFNVVTAKDGSDGLEQLQLIIPDIILSDIEMPKMDGFEFAKNVKNIDAYKNIPIIMITSRTAEKHKSLAFEIGVDGFLGKPYKEEELIDNINQLIIKK